MTTQSRFLIAHEKQHIEWAAADAMPEVVPHHSVVLKTFENQSDALSEIALHLDMIGAVAQWSDVRPIEACACCRRDITTSKPHMALVLSEEIGDEMNPTILSVEYPALFCEECVPASLTMASTQGEKQ